MEFFHRTIDYLQHLRSAAHCSVHVAPRELLLRCQNAAALPTRTMAIAAPTSRSRVRNALPNVPNPSWKVDGVRLTAWDISGALVALLGMGIIVLGGWKT